MAVSERQGELSTDTGSKGITCPNPSRTSKPEVVYDQSLIPLNLSMWPLERSKTKSLGKTATLHRITQNQRRLTPRFNDKIYLHTLSIYEYLFMNQIHVLTLGIV